MAIWPWYGQLALGRLYDAGTFLDVDSYEHVQRWSREIDARPQVLRGRMVNRPFGDPSLQLHERHDAGDFETKTQDKLAPSSAEDS
jgi:GST-like protein